MNATSVNCGGFSLFEMAVIIAIIGVLAWLAIPTIGSVNTSAQLAAAKRSAQNIVSIYASGEAAGVDWKATDVTSAIAAVHEGKEAATGPFQGRPFRVPASPEESATLVKSFLAWGPEGLEMNRAAEENRSNEQLSQSATPNEQTTKSVWGMGGLMAGLWYLVAFRKPRKPGSETSETSSPGSGDNGQVECFTQEQRAQIDVMISRALQHDRERRISRGALILSCIPWISPFIFCSLIWLLDRKKAYTNRWMLILGAFISGAWTTSFVLPLLDLVKTGQSLLQR
jgi:type II secretory pathway pseudopilin PulG